MEFDLDCRFQSSQWEFELLPKTNIRHVSPVEFETLYRRDGKLKTGKHSSFLSCFFFEFCRIFQWSRSLCEDTAIFVECRRDDDKSASDVALQVGEATSAFLDLKKV